MVLLVIDDDELILNLIYYTLHDKYSKIYKAKSFVQTKEILDNERIDLILMDYNLPDVVEFELLKYVRKKHLIGNLPIIMLTSDRSIQLQALKNGANDFITKPFEVDELIARTDNYIELFKHKRLMQDRQLTLEEEVKEQTFQLRRALNDLIIAEKEICNRLGEASEYRDTETGMHIKRMSKLSAHLAKLVGLSSKEVELIENASKLHDVGKVGISDKILQKPGKLTEDEFEIMKTHTTIGANILSGTKSIELLEIAKTIALEHHEKYDGSGYPYGKVGDQIHLYAYIVSIADVFDALSSKRVYKEALPLSEVKSIMLDASGTQFHPDLITIFFNHLDEFVRIRESFPDK